MSSPPLLDQRLQQRYQTLVQQHVTVAQSVAAGLRVPPGLAQPFAAAQAAWRFYANDAVSLPRLAQPLLAHARACVPSACQHYALVIHDWSFLHYNGHVSKADRIPLSQATDLGYNLQSALLVSDRDGTPLAPVFQGLQAAAGVYSSRSEQVELPLSQLDGLSPVMALVRQLGWDKPAVHILDAEADSVGHYRYWNREGHLFVVRADPVNHVRYRGVRCSLREVGQRLRRRGRLQLTRTVEFRGQTVQQYVGATTVTLTRPAKLQRHGRHGPRTVVRGEALELRLIVAELRDAAGTVVACWYLLSNVAKAVAAVTVAWWYYWRARIESFYKLLKGAGLEVEHWQQESAAALARRLLVGSMACVLVWQIARSQAPGAEALRRFLVRLSGRQMKRDRPWTEPALMAGLWVFLTMLAAGEHEDLHAMQRALNNVLANPAGPDSS